MEKQEVLVFQVGWRKSLVDLEGQGLEIRLDGGMELDFKVFGCEIKELEFYF